MQNTNGIRCEEKFLLFPYAVKLVERRDDFRKRNGNIRNDLFNTGVFGNGFENITDCGIVTGKNIAFSAHAVFRAGNNARRDVAHVDEVISAFHGNRQLSGEERQEQLRNASSRRIARAYYSGRKNDACVE